VLLVVLAPREETDGLGVGFDETVLGGCSTNEVSVVKKVMSPSLFVD
jgi:hypothetical protein